MIHLVLESVGVEGDEACSPLAGYYSAAAKRGRLMLTAGVRLALGADASLLHKNLVLSAMHLHLV